MTYRKKLIEVALPLEAINAESAREKSIRHGHPSTLHLWWARRPLAACRAVLFASLVDDPSAHPDKFPTEEAQEKERQRLFKIIEELVLWKNVNNKRVLDAARAEIMRSTDGNPPPVLDPFAGGGSIPLEAQRLGLEAHASDLNPVAVLINKALIEIPPKFAGQPPVNPEARAQMGSKTRWKGAAGLAEDVRYYGQWMRDEAEKRIGHLYPKVTVTKEMLAERTDLREQGLKPGDELTVIAWLWARTVKCPNPACGAQMPLMRSLWLSKKKGQKAWLVPKIERNQSAVQIKFEVRTGKGTPQEPPKVGRGAKFRCLACGQVADEESIRGQFRENEEAAQLTAIVVEGNRKRIYLAPSAQQLLVVEDAQPQWLPKVRMNQDTSDLVSGRGYGFTYWYELFSNRQLVALTTFTDLVTEVRQQGEHDAIEAAPGENRDVHTVFGENSRAYGDAIATYLGIASSKATVFHNTFSRWRTGEGKSAPAFGRQALPMVWDYAEVNPFAGAGGDFNGIVIMDPKI